MRSSELFVAGKLVLDRVIASAMQSRVGVSKHQASVIAPVIVESLEDSKYLSDLLK